jgi:hypothetical protein
MIEFSKNRYNTIGIYLTDHMKENKKKNQEKNNVKNYLTEREKTKETDIVDKHMYVRKERERTHIEYQIILSYSTSLVYVITTV